MNSNPIQSAEAVTPDIVARLSRLVVPNADADARRSRLEASEMSGRLNTLWTRADVPKRHAERATNPGSIDPAHPWTKTRARVLGMLGKGVMVCLTGTRGNGKTQIGVDAILTTTRGGRSAMFVTAQRLFMAFKGSFDEGAKRNEIQVLDDFRRPALLVIDEIGQRAESEWENRTFFELLNARYNDLTDTILTCNLEASKLVASIGPSLASRMQEGGGVMECNWPTFRN